MNEEKFLAVISKIVDAQVMLEQNEEELTPEQIRDLNYAVDSLMDWIPNDTPQ